MEIYENVCRCVNIAHEGLNEALKTTMTIKTVGITNQRETLVAWNSSTGQPYYNAIVWDDTRTTHTAREIAHEAPCVNSFTKDSDKLRAQTGLPLASYFSGTKLRWMLENVPLLRQDLQSESECQNVRFGTIDSWLVYNMTGTPNDKYRTGGIHVTDVTNASRWLLMDLKNLNWDETLVGIVAGKNNPKVPLSTLPQVLR